MAATIKTIAEETRLSNQTVSFVLGKKAHLFRPETQELVRETAERLGYRPSASARAMRSGRSNAIALLLSTERRRSSLLHGFLQGVEAGAHDCGLHLIVTALSDQQLTDAEFVPKILREFLADGLLINYFQETPAAMEELLIRHRIPAIWTNIQRESDCAYPDDLGASREATRTLIRQGHRGIAYVDCTHDHPLERARDHYSAFDRFAGYCEAMREAGLPIREFQTPRKLAGMAVVSALKEWLRGLDRPSAVVTYAGVDAIGILQAVPELSLRLPGDLALVTFGEQPLQFGMVPAATLLVPAEALGQVAVEMLIRKIADPARALKPRQVAYDAQEKTR